MKSRRSRDAVIPVYHETGNVIKTHEHKGEFKEPFRHRRAFCEYGSWINHNFLFIVPQFIFTSVFNPASGKKGLPFYAPSCLLSAGLQC